MVLLIRLEGENGLFVLYLMEGAKRQGMRIIRKFVKEINNFMRDAGITCALAPARREHDRFMKLLGFRESNVVIGGDYSPSMVYVKNA